MFIESDIATLDGKHNCHRVTTVPSIILRDNSQSKAPPYPLTKQREIMHKVAAPAGLIFTKPYQAPHCSKVCFPELRFPISKLVSIYAGANSTTLVLELQPVKCKIQTWQCSENCTCWFLLPVPSLKYFSMSFCNIKKLHAQPFCYVPNFYCHSYLRYWTVLLNVDQVLLSVIQQWISPCF